MSALARITIVGGGLAGLTLGIGLRRHDVPVTVWEAGTYPRHRVCGEFICGRGQDTLERLGLLELLYRAGAVRAVETAFFFGTYAAPARPLPRPALCLSRYALDHALAGHFRALGGELLEATRWRGPESGGGIVRATGRTRAAAGAGWFGLKAHASGVELAADLEMHTLSEGYVGVCRLGPDQVNVCGLFRRGARAGLVGEAKLQLLRGPAGSALCRRLAGARWDETTVCSVGGLDLEPRRTRGSAECRVGDAITMIPPVTGNGMSMAFESAELAIAPLAAHSRGAISWSAACRQIAGDCDRRFATRLAWGRWLQRLMFWPPARGWTGRLALGSNLIWETVFARTR